MYDPYADPLRRRFQPQPDIQAPAFQQPQPVYAQQAPVSPQQPMQWQQMPGEDQQPGMNAGAAGIAELVKRFQQPKAPQQGTAVKGGLGGLKIAPGMNLFGSGHF